MKRIISLILIVLFTAGILTSCSGNKNNNDKLQIVCTVFPEYDWVSNIIGSESESTEITMLLDNGVDLHSYQPSTSDIVSISTCDLFIYVGGESDSWVDDALKEVINKDMIVINLLEVLGDKAKEEVIKEGMDAEDEEAGEGEEEEETEYDEHVWLSLNNAITFCNHISNKICELDEDNADEYRVNTESYIAKLTDLSNEYKQTVDTAKFDTVLFGDRFPFLYLFEDYGLDYFAAFVGCSAETEASFETIAFLADKVDELGLSCVVTIDGSNHEIANTIIQNTSAKNQKIITVNSMQSTTSKEIKNETTYLSVMRKNLEALKIALN